MSVEHQYAFAFATILLTALGIAVTIRIRRERHNLGDDDSAPRLHHLFLVTVLVLLVAGLVAIVITKFVIRKSAPRTTTDTPPSGDQVTVTDAARPPYMPKLMSHGRIEFAEIPPGVSELGCNDEIANECDSDDIARHTYQLRSSIWMMTSEVSNKEYEVCIRESTCRDNGTFTVDVGNQEKLAPVALVTGEDASRYCGSIGGRLPDEEEWEYAARGGFAGRRYLWGEGQKSTGYNVGKDMDAGPARVQSGERNGFGLYNMTGNVAELVLSSSDEQSFVVRGGSFHSELPDLRLAARAPTGPDYMAPTIGFRCVMDNIG